MTPNGYRLFLLFHKFIGQAFLAQASGLRRSDRPGSDILGLPEASSFDSW